MKFKQLPTNVQKDLILRVAVGLRAMQHFYAEDDDTPKHAVPWKLLAEELLDADRRLLAFTLSVHMADQDRLARDLDADLREANGRLRELEGATPEAPAPGA